MAVSNVQAFSRISTISQFRFSLLNLNRVQERIRKIQEQLSSASKINRLSDDTQNITKFFGLQNTLANLEFNLNAVGPMKEFYRGIESQYEDGFNLLTRAKDLALTALDSTTSPTALEGLSEEINQIIEKMFNLSNQEKDGKNILSGKEGKLYTKVADVINYEFSGTKALNSVLNKFGISLPDEQKLFGGFSEDYFGQTDLNPDISQDTKLSELHFGKGVRRGKLIINDGSNTYTIDLSKAEKIKDVINLINTIAGPVITASLNSSNDGLQVSSTTGFISISSELGSNIAEDLGIAGTSALGTISGLPLKPIVTPQTNLSLLNGGNGIDLSGFVIENKTQNAIFTATISISPSDTVGDFLNKINTSGTYVKALISEDGKRINIFSTLQGAQLFLSENGGTTLTDLGIFTDLQHTKLEKLFNGFGIDKELPTNDFRITRKDGVSFEINMQGMQTVGDLIDAINNHPLNTGGLINATTSGNTIVITDNSVGTGRFKIEDINENFIATKFGIKGEFTTNSVTSVDLKPAGSQSQGIFTALIQLREGLKIDNKDMIKKALKLLDKAKEDYQTGQLQIANISNRLDLVNNKLNQLKETFKAELSELADTNLAEAAVEFQKEITILQSAMLTTANILNLSLFNFIT
jgi:flagellar hook-associated protein 3 FlgL